MKGTTSKMSHNSTVIVVVRPLWGRSHVDALTLQVKTCGYAHETPLGSYGVASCAICDIIPKIKGPKSILFPKGMI